jgi:hypothetical protein
MERAPFCLEAIAARSANYLERLVDIRGLPYFNVFWDDPSHAAHDWPDFGDVMSRQYQAAVMLRRMTGRKLSVEDTWRRLLLSFIEAADGLLHRPATGWSKHEADWGDQALALYALVTRHADGGDPEAGKAASAMAAGLLAKARTGDLPPSVFNGFIVKSLMACARRLDRPLDGGPALDLARLIVRKVFDEAPTFSADNDFRHGGHMHGNLRTLVGAADFALYTGDAALLARVDALYRWVRSTGTRFGFLPEVIGRTGDVVACETCALMDYAGLGVTLANHGHPEYWGDMERLARNQYAESQLVDASWLGGGDARADTEQCTWRAIGDRCLGAWAGWSSPTHFLACRETLDAHWGGPELKGRTRALQNCCGGSGVHGLFILWKNAARFADGRLWVHLHVDKALPEAEIRSGQPWTGDLAVSMKRPGDVRVRVPDFVRTADVSVKVNGARVAVVVRDGYLAVDGRGAGDSVVVSYPLPVTTAEESIGNPGHRQYRYRVTWKGDTVVRMEPLDSEHATGYSDFDKREVPVFYGREGPGPLYRRGHLLEGAAAATKAAPPGAPQDEDDGRPDFWAGR